MLLSHSPQMGLILGIIIFVFDNIREKRSVLLTSQVFHILKIIVVSLLKNHCSSTVQYPSLEAESLGM